MDHTNHVRLRADGATVYGAEDEDVGTVSEILESGEVVVDVGGFLGIGAKSIVVPAGQLDFMRDEDGEVHAATSWTESQLKAMPEFPG